MLYEPTSGVKGLVMAARERDARLDPKALASDGRELEDRVGEVEVARG